MKKLLLILTIGCLPFILSAQSGNALKFDNIDDYVYAPGASTHIANSTTMSLSMWVYPQNIAPSFPNFDGFAGFRNNNDADFYILQLSATNVEARFRNSTGIAYDIVFTGLLVNTWQHFVLTLNGTTLTLYHDGVFAGSTTVSGTIANPSESLYMGMLPWPGDDFYFDGQLDEVSLWNKALTLSEISCVQNGGIDPADPNLKLYYKFNQGIAGGNNGGITALTDTKGNINGVIIGFGMNGTTSNFVGGVATPNSVSVNDTLCPGTTYVFGSQNITAPGIYFEVFPLPGGCDSLVQLTLTSLTINTALGQSGPTLTSQQAGAMYQWINCGSGNTPIPGAINQSYTATANGQYAVIVSLGGCSDTSNCINITGVGIHELPASIGIFYPNPFTDELSIKTSDLKEDLFLTIFDPLGKVIDEVKVSSNNLFRINTSNWPSGVYFISDEQLTFRAKCLRYE